MNLSNKLVHVYKNLNREKQGLKDCWSVKTKVDGKWKVIAYVESITLKVSCFKVRQGGRERVLKERQKNVHAWIEGTVEPLNTALDRHITYIPYKGATFFDCTTGEELSADNTQFVTFINSKLYR